MKPTLKDIEDNYERVLLRLHSGELAGIVDNNTSKLQVLRKTHWIDKAITTADLDKSYNGTNSATDFNIDAIAFLSNKSLVNDAILYGCGEIIDWDWDINNPQCNDQLDAYEYAIQKLGLNDNPHKRDYIIKEEKQNMMNEILEIYEEKQLIKINKKYDDLEQSIKKTDERYKVWLKCTTTLDKLYAEDKIVSSAHANIELSEDTKKKLRTMVYDKCEEELRKFYSKKAEVNAQLSMCETYEQKQEILRRYNIINKNGKVNG